MQQRNMNDKARNRYFYTQRQGVNNQYVSKCVYLYLVLYLITASILLTNTFYGIKEFQNKHYMNMSDAQIRQIGYIVINGICGGFQLFSAINMAK